MLTVLMVYHLFGMGLVLKVSGILALFYYITVMFGGPELLDRIRDRNIKREMCYEIIDFIVALGMYYMWGPV